MNRTIYAIMLGAISSLMLAVSNGQIPHSAPVQCQGGTVTRDCFSDLTPELLPMTVGRDVKIVNGFYFLDDRQGDWKVPEGLVTDGASIPPWAWSVVGAPLDGPWRVPAFVHDAACARKDRTWEDTARAFHQALIDFGVPAAKAKIFYEAVYYKGPRWKIVAQGAGPNKTDVETQISQVQRENPGVDIVRRDMQFAGPLGEGYVAFRPVPKPLVTNNQLDRLRKRIELRERRGRPMTLGEIASAITQDRH